MIATFPSLLLALAPLQLPGQPDGLELAQQRLGVELVTPAELHQPAPAAGVPWRFEIEFEGRLYRSWLNPTQVRAQGFRAVARGESELIDCTAPSLGTWRGSLDGLPGVQVAAAQGPDGLRVAVLGDPGGDWFVQPASSLVPGSPYGELWAYRAAAPFAKGACGVEDDAPSFADAHGGSGLGAPAGGCLSLAEIAFDVNYERFLYSSDVVLIQSEVDAYLNAVAAIHSRDFLVDYALTHLEIRTAPGPPYTSDDPGTLLNAMRAEWTSNLAGIPRDVAHLIVGQEMDTNVIGLAYVGVVCNQGFGYGLTQGNLGLGSVISVLSHELGHNWNAPHCLDTEPCNQMCGGCTVFGPITVQRIKDFVAAIGCLDSIPPATSPFPPFATPLEAQGFGPLTLDPLEGDHDANCEPLSLAAPATSLQGGSLSVLPGAGPNGRDLLRYLPPSLAFEGEDSFLYTASDPGGLSASAEVRLLVRDGVADLVAHYRLDDTLDTSLTDSSPFAFSGMYWDGVNQGVPGAAQGTSFAVRFDGAPERARHPAQGSPVSPVTGEFSVALWVRPGQLLDWQRYYGNAQTWSVGQRDNRMLLTAHGIKDYLSPPLLVADQWQHVAYVVTPGHDVRFFLDGQFQAQANGTQPFLTEPASGWFLATRNHEDEYYVGDMDDLQVYDAALTDAQIAELFASPGQPLGEDCAALNYCEATPSSVGTSAVIGQVGSLSVADQSFSLFATGAPAGQFGLFFYGAGFTQTPAANGYLCVSGPTRMGATLIDALGTANWPVDLSQPTSGGAAILGGSTWCFQFWFRDPSVGAGSNFSDGLAVRFCQ